MRVGSRTHLLLRPRWETSSWIRWLLERIRWLHRPSTGTDCSIWKFASSTTRSSVPRDAHVRCVLCVKIFIVAIGFIPYEIQSLVDTNCIGIHLISNAKLCVGFLTQTGDSGWFRSWHTAHWVVLLRLIEPSPSILLSLSKAINNRVFKEIQKSTQTRKPVEFP